MRRLFTGGKKHGEIAYVYLPPDGWELEALRAQPRQDLERLKLVFGHFPYGVDALLQLPGRYITCLRETGPRLTSNYWQHVRGGFVGDMGLLDYFNQWKPKDMDNYTVRLLAGVGHDVPFGGVTRVHLEQAKHNLRHGCAAFGLYEYLPETVARFRKLLGRRSGQALARLRKLLGLAAVDLGRENVMPVAQRGTKLPANELAVLLRHNALDEELYAYARGLFLADGAAAYTNGYKG